MSCVEENRFGSCFVMPASFYMFRDVLPAFHEIGQFSCPNGLQCVSLVL
jgi:hypothetical protein